jgi:hypothetical protein
MATSKQEQLYNEIIQYYDFADKLVQVAENSQDELGEQQFDIIQDAIEKFEKCADDLANNYIEYVKTGESKVIIELMRNSLREISIKIEECRNKITSLHNKK